MKNQQTNDFLPQGYEQPKGNANYMKLEKGSNEFRILTKPIIGWLDWKDKKPLRFRMDNKPSAPVDPTKPIKHFWSFIVWNYTTASIQILEITQGTIQGAINSLVNNPKWGAPYNYDISVDRKGDGMDTEYTIMPSPKSPLANGVADAFGKKPCNIEMLFDSQDPFNPTGTVTSMEIAL